MGLCFFFLSLCSVRAVDVSVAMRFSYAQLDSTNRLAKELAAKGKPAGTVVHAATQSSGRGQYGRIFTSPRGGLYFSLILEPALPPERLSLVTLATGLACRNVLHNLYQLQPAIKWPNDVYLGGKKVAGILCESVWPLEPAATKAQVIVGVGMNVNTVRTEYPEEIRPIITTLVEELRTTVDCEQLLNSLLESIMAHVAQLEDDPGPILAEWQRFDFFLNKSISCTSESAVLHGVGKGIDAQGFYRLLDRSGVEHRILGGGHLRLHE